jgi:signal transduction histidine kinase/cbb3-type cytochrome oxidase subunit 3
MKRLSFYPAFATVVLFAFLIAVTWILVRSGGRQPKDLASAIQDLKTRFQSQTPPLRELNVQEILASRRSPELREAVQALPHFLEPRPEAEILAAYADRCGTVPTLRWGNDELRKAFTWHQFLCGQTQVLPNSFFETPPFMHPSGQSYAWLAQKSQDHPETWISDHRTEFHILEVLNIPEIAGLQLGVEPGSLGPLLSSEVLVVTPKKVIMSPVVQNEQRLRNPLLVYDRSKWEHFLLNEPWVPSPAIDSAACLLKEQSQCWISNPKYKKGLRNPWVQLLLLALLTGLSLVAVLWRRRYRFEKNIEEQRIFVAQMLTHELRTPATALNLGLETFRQDFDELPVRSQKAFLQMSQEVQRLNRVLETSRDYLTSEDSPPTDAVQSTPLNRFLQSICDRYDGVTYSPLSSDPELKFHRRWLELCLKNLIENGLVHGQPPIEVELIATPKFFEIHVRDQGRSAFQSLDEMTAPLRKGPESPGLGLGLTLIQKVLRRMRANLLFRNEPTTFIIQLRKTV